MRTVNDDVSVSDDLFHGSCKNILGLAAHGIGRCGDVCNTLVAHTVNEIDVSCVTELLEYFVGICNVGDRNGDTAVALRINLSLGTECFSTLLHFVNCVTELVSGRIFLHCFVSNADSARKVQTELYISR